LPKLPEFKKLVVVLNLLIICIGLQANHSVYNR